MIPPICDSGENFYWLGKGAGISLNFFCAIPAFAVAKPE
jgi:hypothetical protein